MKRALVSCGILVATFLMAGCPSLPPVSGCAIRASTCMDDRPFICSGTGRWTPVGDATCQSVGGVCCMTADGVHACVTQPFCME